MTFCLHQTLVPESPKNTKHWGHRSLPQFYTRQLLKANVKSSRDGTRQLVCSSVPAPLTFPAVESLGLELNPPEFLAPSSSITGIFSATLRQVWVLLGKAVTDEQSYK